MTSTEYNHPQLPIGIVARMLGVSVQTLRHYEAEGLLLIAKSAGKQRLYSNADVDRIACIQKAINELKISIGGLKRIFAMIPCWEVLPCPKEERMRCPAYLGHFGGCWTHDHRNTYCAGNDCRVCDVYSLSNNCEQIKELITRSTHTMEPEPE